MKQNIRIQKDITLFNNNYNLLDRKTLSEDEKQVATLAYQYFQDAEYYLNKKDYFTAFGCINYAHGLLDALIKF